MKIKNHSRICLIISATIFLVAIVMSLCGAGINYGIDFAGGSSITYDMKTAFDTADVENAMKALGVTDYKVSIAGDAGTELQLRVSDKTTSSDESVQTLRDGLEAQLAEKYPEMTYVSVSRVGPVAGRTLVSNAIWSVLIASALMLIYIAFRFDLNSGMAAVFGLLHDVLMMLAFMVILRSVIQMNSSFIAAMLTIVGYSINNTIVIFDRIRENNRKAEFANRKREEVVNISIKESLGRTINTTLTTLVTIVSLYILGVDAIREFSLPIIVGILSGVYSANMINGYVWAFLEEKRKGMKAAKKLKAKKA